MSREDPRAAILDIDGTLVDTNYHHVLAWYRAFHRFGVTPPLWRIHRHLGMGGDRLVGEVAGEEVERRLGDDIRKAETDLYMALVDEVVPFQGARDLIVELRNRNHPVVLASSAKQHEVDHYLDLLEVRDLVQDWTTSGDVNETKPSPDLVVSALERVGADRAVLVGDSTFDIEAAKPAGVPTLAVLTGGFSASELLDAGARRAFESIARLKEALQADDLEALVR